MNARAITDWAGVEVRCNHLGDWFISLPYQAPGNTTGSDLDWGYFDSREEADGKLAEWSKSCDT